MKTMRNILGYVLGGLLFVLLVPAVMWFASLMPKLCIACEWRIVVAVVLAVVGISLSVWSIVYPPLKDLRQHRTILMVHSRRRFFVRSTKTTQLVWAHRQGVLVQYDGKDASEGSIKASAANCAVLP